MEYPVVLVPVVAGTRHCHTSQDRHRPSVLDRQILAHLAFTVYTHLLLDTWRTWSVCGLSC